jgi:hypothetical protein
METLIRVRKGDTCIVACNNSLYYAIALENFIEIKADGVHSWPTIFRFITVDAVSAKWDWTYSSFKRRIGYDKIQSDHITGQYVHSRVAPYPTNLLSKEIQESITEFKTKFNL